MAKLLRLAALAALTGTLAATPRMVRQAGVTDENERYKQRVIDLGVAAFLTPWLTARVGRPGTVRIMLVVAAIALLGLGLPMTLPTILAGSFVLGLVGQAIKLCSDAAVQREVGDDVRGRVFSLSDTTFNVTYVVAVAGAAFLCPPSGRSPLLLVLAAAITANLAGLFALPQLAVGGAGRGQGAFATGLLAAFVATPCTGPFMAAAMGAALLLPLYHLMDATITLLRRLARLAHLGSERLRRQGEGRMGLDPGQRGGDLAERRGVVRPVTALLHARPELRHLGAERLERCRRIGPQILVILGHRALYRPSPMERPRVSDRTRASPMLTPGMSRTFPSPSSSFLPRRMDSTWASRPRPCAIVFMRPSMALRAAAVW